MVQIDIRDILSNLLADQTILDQYAHILVDIRLPRCPKHATIPLMATSGQSEIDQDVRRLIKNGLITKKIAQYVAYVVTVKVLVCQHN